MTTKKEYLAWCKLRAHKYVDLGNLNQAVMSMVSDLSNHPETNIPALDMLMLVGMMEAQRGTDAVRKWINDFSE